MGSKAGSKDKKSLISGHEIECLISLFIIFCISITVVSLHKYNSLVDKYANLADKHKNTNQKFAAVLEEIDNSIKNNNITAIAKSIYLFDGIVNNTHVKVFANVEYNLSAILNDIEKLPYKDNLSIIKIKNIDVHEKRIENDTQVAFGVGGIYIPSSNTIEMYDYYPEGLFHEDCHHIFHNKVNPEDAVNWQLMYADSSSNDFISDYSKTDQFEDFAETCKFAVLNKATPGTTLLKKKVDLIKKYV